MGDKRATLRYELKLACQESAQARVRAALRMHPSGLRTLFPPRVVQSVYLDTPFHRALEENLAGVSDREKLRFRWYGGEARGVRGVLERKVRENTLGWKQSFAVQSDVTVEGTNRRRFVDALVAGVDEGARERLRHGLEPVQWIRYRREYLQTADGCVRVTLDTELRAFDQRALARLSSSAPSPTPRILVIEAKCAPESYEAARRLLERLPVPVDRCSKFVLASESAHGPNASILPV